MTYQSEVLADSPKGYWRFEETSGTTAADSTAFSHPGTVTAGSDLSAAGKVGSGISFPGGYTGDKVTIGAGNVLGTGWAALSVEGWFKTTTAAGSSVVDNYDGGASNERNYTLRLNSDGSLNWRVGFDLWYEQSITSPATGYHDGNWHHVVGTHDGAVARLYVDGSLVATSGSTTGAPNLSSVSSLKIGVGQGLSFAGSIDEVAIYDTALSSTRVSAHYAAASAAPTYSDVVLADTPAMYLPMQEAASATVATDLSGNARHGTYVNGVVTADTTDGAAPAALGAHVRLDGSNDHVNLATGSWFNPTTAGFTFEGWYYVRSWVGYTRIFDFSNSVSSDDMYLMPSNGTPSLVVKNNGSSFTFTPSSWPVNTWTHVVQTTTASGTTNVYLNGVLVASGTTNTLTTGTRNNMYLGRSPWPGDPYLSASLSHVAVYHSVLSQERITAHYEATLVPGPNKLHQQAALVAAQNPVNLLHQQAALVAAQNPVNLLHQQALLVAIAPVTPGAPPSTSYTTTVMADTPAMYLPMQDDPVAGSTTAWDISGNTRHGTYVNGAAQRDTTDGVTPGILGEHVRLDGTDDYVQLATGSWFNPTTAGFTFEGWYYVRSFQSWMRIFDLGNAANVTDTMLMYNVTNNNMGMYVANSGPLSFAKWAVNTWVHLVVTVTTAGAVKVYLDGAETATGSLSAPTSGTRDRMWLGRSQYGADGYTTTSLCHVAMYHTALTPTRVAAHYAARLPAATGPSWSVWNGTTEVPATVTVWNGTSEVATTTEIAP